MGKKEDLQAKVNIFESVSYVICNEYYKGRLEYLLTLLEDKNDAKMFLKILKKELKNELKNN